MRALFKTFKYLRFKIGAQIPEKVHQSIKELSEGRHEGYEQDLIKIAKELTQFPEDTAIEVLRLVDAAIRAASK